MTDNNKKKFSKNPSFKNTDLNSLITEFALGITAHKNDEYYASGTAIVIAPNLAITAAHVIEDFVNKFEKIDIRSSPNKKLDGTFHMQVFQILNNSTSGFIWNVTKLWSCRFTDIAVLRLSPVSQEALQHKWRAPKIDLIPPKVGERVSCFGYSKPKIIKNEKEINWAIDPRTSVGEVMAIHHEKRDNCRLPFPCFQTNARYDGAMSGGPVFNNSGHLCGIICSNLPPSSENEDHVSYVTSLWPLMGLEIDMNRKGYPPNTKYPILDLAQDNFIKANGWEKIKIVKDNNNKTRISLKKE